MVVCDSRVPAAPCYTCRGGAIWRFDGRGGRDEGRFVAAGPTAARRCTRRRTRLHLPTCVCAVALGQVSHPSAGRAVETLFRWVTRRGDGDVSGEVLWAAGPSRAMSEKGAGRGGVVLESRSWMGLCAAGGCGLDVLLFPSGRDM